MSSILDPASLERGARGQSQSLLELNQSLQAQHACASYSQVNPVAVGDELREASGFLNRAKQIEWSLVRFHQLVAGAPKVRLVQT